MTLSGLKIATFFFLLGSISLSGCSGHRYSFESYVDKLPKTTDARKKEIDYQRIFSNNVELNYVATNSLYRINVGDKLDIKVFKVPELDRVVRVNSKGNISFPLIGKFHPKGLSQEEAEEELASVLEVKYLQNPQINISVDNEVNNKITIGGEVRKSGVFSLNKSTTLLQAIALSGGLTNMADPTKVILFRKATYKTYLLNARDISNGKSGDPYIQADDHIVVARSGARSFIRDASTILGGLVSPLWGLILR